MKWYIYNCSSEPGVVPMQVEIPRVTGQGYHIIELKEYAVGKKYGIKNTSNDTLGFSIYSDNDISKYLEQKDHFYEIIPDRLYYIPSYITTFTNKFTVQAIIGQ